jgi:nicotinamide-nucleotide amidase
MMHGEIITTGNELLTGRIGDFNARYAARRLHEAGLVVQRLTILGDHSPLFQDLLAEALVRSQFISLPGGSAPPKTTLPWPRRPRP